jgi:hypothetical protein
MANLHSSDRTSATTLLPSKSMTSILSRSSGDDSSTSKARITEEEHQYASRSFLGPWFPAVNYPPSKKWRTLKARRHVVILGSLATMLIVCMTNTVLTIVAWHGLGGWSDGVVTIHQGDCGVVKRADAFIHIGINVLSTLLLSASNFVMQLVAAPTRKEVDTAHRKGIWLDIGVPSFRNLRQISRSSRLLWICLAASSLPIHFL